MVGLKEIASLRMIVLKQDVVTKCALVKELLLPVKQGGVIITKLMDYIAPVLMENVSGERTNIKIFAAALPSRRFFDRIAVWRTKNILQLRKLKKLARNWGSIGVNLILSSSGWAWM